MSESEFPPNSETSKKGAPSGKNIRPVVSGGAVRRKKSLRKQFSDTFFAGNFRSSANYVVLDILLPEVKNLVLEVVSGGVEKLIFGDSRRRRGSTPPTSGPTGYVSYNRYSSTMSPRQSGPSRALSRQARSQHQFDDIVLDERAEAEQVIDQLFDLVSKYGSATVADLYELVGLASTHTDHKWGWEELMGAGVSRVRGGYLLDLPDPEPLD
jgi:hypothetical protein